jgi:hypothetical protein
MRASRLPTPWTVILLMLVGAIVLALLGVLTMAVAAQDEDDDGDEAFTATYVTGEIIQTQGTGDAEYWEEDGVEHTRGMLNEQTIEWSDARLPSRLLIAYNLASHNPDAGAIAASYRLEDDLDGAWVGIGHGFQGYPDGASPMAAVGLMTLTGEGAYEGLSAMIANKLEDGASALEGYIFEGALPPIPDPVDPNSPQYAD